MNRLPICAAFFALAILSASHGEEPPFKFPGTDESAAVDRANVELGKVYKELMSLLDPQAQKALREAERAWIKWRDSEAEFRARAEGAVGGSALRVGIFEAEEKLIRERIKVLKRYVK